MKQGDVIASIFFILVGICFTIGAIGLGVGTPIAPKSGFFPFLGGITLIALSGILLFQAWRGRSIGTQAFGKFSGLIIVVLALAFYVTTLEIMGYLITTAILSAIVLRVLGTRSLWVLLVTGLILSIGSYILFNRLLDVPLPSGILANFW